MLEAAQPFWTWASPSSQHAAQRSFLPTQASLRDREQSLRRRPDHRRPPQGRHIALVFNTTEGDQAVEDSRDIRAVALYDKIPYFTTAAGAQAAAMAMAARVEGGVDVRSLQG